MSERLLELAPDIESLPSFMHKVKMLMIPSVGYFTVVSKLDRSYLDFISAHQGEEDEDKVIDLAFGGLLEEVGWKLCF